MWGDGGKECKGGSGIAELRGSLVQPCEKVVVWLELMFTIEAA